jgi:hypothetical protein
MLANCPAKGKPQDCTPVKSAPSPRQRNHGRQRCTGQSIDWFGHFAQVFCEAAPPKSVIKVISYLSEHCNGQGWCTVPHSKLGCRSTVKWALHWAQAAGWVQWEPELTGWNYYAPNTYRLQMQSLRRGGGWVNRLAEVAKESSKDKNQVPLSNPYPKSEGAGERAKIHLARPNPNPRQVDIVRVAVKLSDAIGLKDFARQAAMDYIGRQLPEAASVPAFEESFYRDWRRFEAIRDITALTPYEFFHGGIEQLAALEAQAEERRQLRQQQQQQRPRGRHVHHHTPRQRRPRCLTPEAQAALAIMAALRFSPALSGTREAIKTAVELWMDLHPGKGPEWAVNPLVAVWKDYKAAAPWLKYHWGAMSFFGEHHWPDPGSWPVDLQALRMAREASVGTYRPPPAARVDLAAVRAKTAALIAAHLGQP